MPSPPAALEPLTRRPLLLVPNRVYRLWQGGAVLDRFQGKPHGEDGHYPEEWIGSTAVSRLPGRPPDEGLSRISLPDGGAIGLKTLIEAFPEAMLGAPHVARHGTELAVLCKLLDSSMRLFIQAHPDAAFARRHLSSTFGKTESWIILATRPIAGEEPYILFGFREGVTEAEFRRITRVQDLPAMVEALNRIPVRPGEVYLVEAGTPHALGPGVLLVEIQEPTDLVINAEHEGTGRTEAQAFLNLGLDLAMSCFNYQAVGLDFVIRRRLAPRLLADDSQATEERLIGPEDTPSFGAARLTVRGCIRDRDRGRCYAGVVTAGRGAIETAAGPIPLQVGSTLFVPAASTHEAYRAAPGQPLTVIKCFPPA
jgi:mannose-6-phosphate isomerase